MTIEAVTRKPGRTLAVWGCVALIAVAVFAGYFIFRTPGEGATGLFDWLPWLLVALCPLMHLFMHKGHGRHTRDRDE